jgi:hypothetical protein
LDRPAASVFAEAQCGVGGEDAEAEVDREQIGEALVVFAGGRDAVLTEQPDMAQFVRDDRRQEGGI